MFKYMDLNLNQAIEVYTQGNYELSRRLFRQVPVAESINYIDFQIQIYLLICGDYTEFKHLPIHRINVERPSIETTPISTPTESLNLNPGSDIEFVPSRRETEVRINMASQVNETETGHLSFHSIVDTKLKNGDEDAILLHAIWHMDVHPLTGQNFPRIYNGIFNHGRTDAVKNTNKGISILEQLAKGGSIHASYFLAKIYIRFSSSIHKGNTYLVQSAKNGSIQAQKDLNAVGVNWHDIDQLGDHCVTWCCIPQCTMDESCGDRIQSCIGCGKVPDGSGWVSWNCGICGIKTELNCAGIAEYVTNGFLNVLRSLNHPIKLLACLSSIASIGLQNDESTKSYGLIMQYVVTGLTTLSLFIRQETE